MTAQTFAVLDRAFDEASLYGTKVNLDGDQDDDWGPPAGFGDCALLEVYVEVQSIATLQSSFFTEAGPSAQLWEVGLVRGVEVGMSDFWKINGATNQTVSARISPDQVQFWREGERLRIRFREIDENATPTADLFVWVKVRRLRPLLSRTPEETQFFLTS